MPRLTVAPAWERFEDVPATCPQKSFGNTLSNLGIQVLAISQYNGGVISNRRPMLDLRLCHDAKETDNKLRWDVFVREAGTTFSIYIPKWRVPTPWPSRIFVSVTSRRVGEYDAPNLSIKSVREAPVRALEPIVVSATRYSNHTKTIRFNPDGDNSRWETGSLYIPISLLEDGSDSERVRLIILWDMSSQGEFGESEHGFRDFLNNDSSNDC